MNMRASAIFSLVAMFVFHASTAHAAENTLTGTWRTEAPIPYLVEYTPEHPQGTPIQHEGARILERSASMEWTLIQRRDGLITGTNDWIAYDEKGQKIFEGSEPLLGAYDDQRIVLTEPPDETAKTAQIVFEVTREGRDRIRGIGYSVAGPKLLAMRFTLVKVQN